ncbi:IS66 family transposase [Fuerstiella marisgermanici]|uniref:Transposase n=1 Tax=Fuerstiella marisgermanici TaxID=1891926 RepID=A0A1P8WGP5_9PLAN|nr:transposase [Fuerstiella marisgermanici]APZ90510.1 Transposase [Fuerstiella marisgermanici]APZ90763.1 Transposase [Fuerstiella marisgermanici]APZ90991.1 Transposase [Fuerstiella marisgermanici]APZ91268.1 Transposase [Fuerstiella marisgermanici]APZ91329.1 Transposase [Fuerstiella marisgermanici]
MDTDVSQIIAVEVKQLVLSLQREVAELRDENRRLRDRIEELEGKNPTERLDEAFSVTAEERRRAETGRRKGRKKQSSARRGRRTTEQKADNAERRELILPEGYNVAECRFVRERFVWRVINGQAVQVVYEIYHGPNGEKSEIPGVWPRSEFGIEVHIALARIVTITGLSIDKTCALIEFFWNLPLGKSQADALLNQLARRWEQEFESLCDLMAFSAIVHADETSWSINSVWAFLSEKARVLIFGCRKDGDTLAQILSKELFGGVLVSDDAAVYRGFSHAQKCWAHLLRKAIRLTLLKPDNEEYQRLLDGLLEIFYAAKRHAADGRLGDAGRAAKVDELDNTLAALLVRYCAEDSDVRAADFGKDFDNLVSELIRLMTEEELFCFVTSPAAPATNNEAERSLRGAAMDRRTGRTSKTSKGARRRSILTSVLESLNLHLKTPTLSSVVAEVMTWQQDGFSLFDRLKLEVGLTSAPPGQSRLSKLVPAN